MRNVDMSVEAGVLTIKIKLDAPGEPSTSGKSLVIGTTSGNHVVPGTNVTVGINCYVPAPKAAK